jgi:hypothetical protein
MRSYNDDNSHSDDTYLYNDGIGGYKDAMLRSTWEVASSIDGAVVLANGGSKLDTGPETRPELGVANEPQNARTQRLLAVDRHAAAQRRCAGHAVVSSSSGVGGRQEQSEWVGDEWERVCCERMKK